MENELSPAEVLFQSLNACNDIRHELSSKRLNLSDEKVLQDEINDTIRKNTCYSPIPEVRLSSTDIIDFMVMGLGIEVKIKGSKTAIYRQVERYAQHDRIKVLLLITNKAVKMPEIINSKRVYVMQLGGAWL